MMGVYNTRNVSEPSSGIKLTAYSCICWLLHRIYFWFPLCFKNVYLCLQMSVLYPQSSQTIYGGQSLQNYIRRTVTTISSPVARLLKQASDSLWLLEGSVIGPHIMPVQQCPVPLSIQQTTASADDTVCGTRHVTVPTWCTSTLLVPSCK